MQGKKLTAGPTKREIEKTFNFVIDELVRHIATTKDPESYLKVVKEDGWFFEIPLPNGSKRLIGRKAHERLYGLAREIVETDDRIKDRLSPILFHEILSEQLGRAIFEREEIEEKDFVDFCIKLSVSEKLKSKDFYVPCIAPYFDGMKKFKIGPVTFYDKNYFLKTQKSNINVPEPHDFIEFEDCYKIQNWIAHIRVDGFDSKHAEERAFLCIRLAIASIKVRLERSLAQWLGTEKQSMPGLTRYLLTSEPDSQRPNEIFLGWGRQFILNGGNDQVDHLLSHSSHIWFKIVGAFLEKISCSTGWGYLNSKIVTALIWLDIGNSPISDAERVVAFSNGLEALFVTKEKGKKQQLVLRSKLLLDHSGWRVELNGKMDEFYSVRGSIVHGDIMPLGLEISSAANIGKYLTDVCIEGFVHFSYWLLNKHHQAGTKMHERPFNGHGSFNRAMEHELPLFIEEINEQLRRT